MGCAPMKCARRSEATGRGVVSPFTLPTSDNGAGGKRGAICGASETIGDGCQDEHEGCSAGASAGDPRCRNTTAGIEAGSAPQAPGQRTIGGRVRERAARATGTSEQSRRGWELFERHGSKKVSSVQRAEGHLTSLRMRSKSSGSPLETAVRFENFICERSST